MLPVEPHAKKFSRPQASLDARESTLEGRACRYAKSLGYYVRKYKSPGRRAAPDRFFKHSDGVPFFIEFKGLGKQPTALQLAEHDEMRAVGLIVYVVDNYEAAKAIIDKHCL